MRQLQHIYFISLKGNENLTFKSNLNAESFWSFKIPPTSQYVFQRELRVPVCSGYYCCVMNTPQLSIKLLCSWILQVLNSDRI